MLAIDWSHTKDLTTFDGKKVKVVSLKQLLTTVSKDGGEGESKPSLKSRRAIQPLPPSDSDGGGESTKALKSSMGVQPPSIVLEQGCPMTLIYNLVKAGAAVALIDNKATENYRKEHDIEKTDENDAKIIWNLSQNGAKLQPVTVDDKLLQLHDIYHQYCRFQKARVSLENMKKAHRRQYAGASESSVLLQSNNKTHLAPDLSPYDIAIDTLHAREKTLIKKLGQTAKGLPLFEAGGESKPGIQSNRKVHPPAIRGLGQRIWLGLMVTANPANFKCLSAYLRYCGLTSDVIESHKYNRHARMLYHMLAESVMKQRDDTYRPIYDKCKADIAEKYPDYKKIHIHNAALNRTATFLAKDIYRLSCGGESISPVKSILIVQPPQLNLKKEGGQDK